MTRPLILVTNDDGVLAEGLRVLVEAVADLGEVVVCAPDTERSGASQAITLHSYLRANHIREGWWAVNGTPVDCVYLGVIHLCGRRPDLVLAGVNPGYNLGTDVFYSGTVGAAAEGFLRGASGIAFSTPVGQPPQIATPTIRTLVRKVLAEPERCLLNVNLPEVVPAVCEGAERLAAAEIVRRSEGLPMAVTRLGRRAYQEFVERRTDLRGKPYFWIGGPPEQSVELHGEDTWAVANGMVAVTPLVLDITAPDLEPWRQRLAGVTSRLESDDDR
ncbi:MAG: 5'/3'-nucleotidase SurE [Nannocystis sp.]|nr:5'/3'-nucleotidase SurE [Nannocystis sp.]